MRSANVAMSKAEREEFRAAVRRLEAQEEALALQVKAGNVLAWNLAKAWKYWKGARGDASKISRLMAAVRAYAASEGMGA